jgi:hypothetical protein
MGRINGIAATMGFVGMIAPISRKNLHSGRNLFFSFKMGGASSTPSEKSLGQSL